MYRDSDVSWCDMQFLHFTDSTKKKTTIFLLLKNFPIPPGHILISHPQLTVHESYTKDSYLYTLFKVRYHYSKALIIIMIAERHLFQLSKSLHFPLLTTIPEFSKPLTSATFTLHRVHWHPPPLYTLNC